MARAHYGPSSHAPKAIKATKVLQDDLIRQANLLREDPTLALPECSRDHRSCPFPRLRSQVRKVAELADDKKRLEKLSRRGDPLVRAYAGTLLLTHQEKAPYLATARVGNTDVPYAARGKTKREMLLGVQHFDDPFLRLLSVAEVAEKRGLYVFSLNDRMVCAGRDPVPPPEYLPQALRTSGYVLQETEFGFSCPHLTAEEATLSLRWPAADSQIQVCAECASDDTSLGSTLAHRMVAPRSASVFEVVGRPHFACDVHEDGCPLGRESRLPDRDMPDYLAGDLTDHMALDATVNRVMQDARGGLLYAANGVCYGDDLEGFAASLRGSEAERAAVRAILTAAGDGWVGNGTTVGKILAAHWAAHAEDALSAVADGDVACRLLDSGIVKDPAALLRMAVLENQKEEVAASLPAYGRLPPVASLADTLARACRFKSADAAAKEAENLNTRNRVERVVAYAFLLAIGEGAGKEWKYTPDEVDLAAFLKTFAEGMIGGTAEEYHEALQNILTASGSGETVKLPKS